MKKDSHGRFMHGGKMPKGMEELDEHGRKGKKRGGKVHGKEAGHRPDRRARGGATSDQHPMTSAEHMSEPLERGAPDYAPKGKGRDRD